ncbi:MAG: ATP-binding cassette domain-containing protein [Coriobacteriia bacterium]|nr:ATP-binding cassette domain-containing protein [Coriobacteriia bacterium]
MKLQLRNLRKSYGSRVVLDVQSCEIPSGVITGIIGPNGAGKTTLMNIIAGLDLPQSGEVLYELGDGSFSSSLPTQAVTMLFQTPYMIRTTVEKNIAYPLRIRGMEREVVGRRVNNLLDAFDLTPLAKSKAWLLSGGETQKVALARAIALKPQLLLLDEPTSNIDNTSVAFIEKTLDYERTKHKMTSVIISHNLPQIRRLCNYVLFMHEGNIIEHGSSEQLLTQPQDPRTQAFIEGELLL